MIQISHIFREVNRYIRPQKEKIDDIEPLDEYYGVAQVRNNIEKKPVLDDAVLV